MGSTGLPLGLALPTNHPVGAAGIPAVCRAAQGKKGVLTPLQGPSRSGQPPHAAVIAACLVWWQQTVGGITTGCTRHYRQVLCHYGDDDYILEKGVRVLRRVLEADMSYVPTVVQFLVSTKDPKVQLKTN